MRSPRASKDLPVLLRRVPETRLGTVIRAFFLVQPVPTADLTKAIGERGVGSLEAAGVADVGDDEVAVQMRILPVAGLLVASDDDPTHEDDDCGRTSSPPTPPRLGSPTR